MSDGADEKEIDKGRTGNSAGIDQTRTAGYRFVRTCCFQRGSIAGWETLPSLPESRACSSGYERQGYGQRASPQPHDPYHGPPLYCQVYSPPFQRPVTAASMQWATEPNQVCTPVSAGR